MATANVVIRCVDPEDILRQLPDNLRALAKVHAIDKEYTMRRYNNDEGFREKEKARLRELNRKKYAENPKYRARKLAQCKQRLALTKQEGVST